MKYTLIFSTLVLASAAQGSTVFSLGNPYNG